MHDMDRQYYTRLNQQARRIGARLEALACGYVTADMQALGGEEAGHRDVMDQIRALGRMAELCPEPPSRAESHG
jgi:hypothetical protein